ncbi:MAG TPA: FAD:protein FMN transferase, partial [Planctomycetes bacterium]|nr:FAD:protein FMN transferase [Planctomycetota bacterium]
MGRLIALWVLGAGITATSPEGPSLHRYQFTQVAMAVPIRIILYAPNEATANRAAEAAFQRFEELDKVFSDYNPHSEARRLGNLSGQGRAVPVSCEMWEVLVRAQHLAAQTGGAFDVTVGPLVRLWRRARRQKELPPSWRLEQFRQLVGYRLLRLDGAAKTVELTRKGMRLDFGGIAKGYGIDQALKVLRRHGIASALVDAGGDIGLGSPPPGKPGWIIGVASLDPKGKPSIYLYLSGRAIATSGDSRQFVHIGGRRYSHLVDPRTGQALTDHSSVTVIAPDATTADALASAISVLGPEQGLALVERLPDTAAYVVRAPAGRIERYQSARWPDPPTLKPRERLPG